MNGGWSPRPGRGATCADCAGMPVTQVGACGLEEKLYPRQPCRGRRRRQLNDLVPTVGGFVVEGWNDRWNLRNVRYLDISVTAR